MSYRTSVPEENPQSTAKIGGHPLHPMLVPFPIAFFTLALVTDLAYWSTTNLMWSHFSSWLIAAGLLMGSLAALAGLIDFWSNRAVRAQPPAWPHFLGNVLVLAFSLLNAFVHARDGWTAVVPWGLILSASVVAIMCVTGWLGWSMVYRHRVGILP